MCNFWRAINWKKAKSPAHPIASLRDLRIEDFLCSVQNPCLRNLTLSVQDSLFHYIEMQETWKWRWAENILYCPDKHHSFDCVLFSLLTCDFCQPCWRMKLFSLLPWCLYHLKHCSTTCYHKAFACIAVFSTAFLAWPKQSLGLIQHRAKPEKCRNSVW